MDFRHPDPRGPLMGYVLLADAAPTLEALQTALEAEFGPVQTVGEPEASGDPQCLIVSTPTANVFVATASSPSLSDARVLCRPGWWQGQEPLAEHAAEVLLRVFREPDATLSHESILAEAIGLSAVAAVLAGLPGALAFSYPNGGLTMPTGPYADYVRQAFDAGLLPYDAWVSVWVDVDDAVSATTIGLAAFGHAELTVADSTRTPQDVNDLLHGVAKYLVASGERLDPGAALGYGSDDAQHLVSADPEGTALRIGF